MNIIERKRSDGKSGRRMMVDNNGNIRFAYPGELNHNGDLITISSAHAKKKVNAKKARVRNVDGNQAYIFTRNANKKELNQIFKNNSSSGSNNKKAARKRS